MPWLHLEHFPHALIIAHEVGHIVEHDFGLEDRVEDAIVQALTDSGVDETRMEAWKAWRAEVFADLFACHAAGPEFVWTLVDLIARRAQDVITQSFDDQLNWGNYPSMTLRVMLNAAGLELLGHASEAKSIRAEWTASYPTHAMTAFEPDLEVVAKAVLSSPAGLLPDSLAFPGTGKHHERALSALSQNLPLPEDGTLRDPRIIVSAASALYRRRPADDHRARWDAARRHIVNARLPGLLADPAEAVDRLDDDGDRRAGRVRQSLLRGSGRDRRRGVDGQAIFSVRSRTAGSPSSR